jgi:gliding motility-associated-like protein
MKTLNFHFNFPRFPASQLPCPHASKPPCLSLSPLLLLSLSLFLLLSPTLFAQREADNWIIGEWIDVNFTSGDPSVSFVRPLDESGFEGTSMSDSLGNLLFFYGMEHVYNRDGQVMQNGDSILPEWHDNGKHVITFPKPGTESQYYIFGVASNKWAGGICYSVIDMSLDGGLGAVTSEKNVHLEAANAAQGGIYALKNATGDGYWVVARLFNDDRYVSFKITSGGVNPVPVYSPTGIFRQVSSGSGPMRISQDKKYLISCFWTWFGFGSLEVSSFDSQTGVIGFKYMIQPGLYKPSDPTDCEISPDSKFLYVNWINGPDSALGLYQYNMKLIDDSATFFNSGIHILWNNDPGGVQLSNDGRIYFEYKEEPEDQHFYRKFLSVINRPWEIGIDCDIDTMSLYLGGRERSYGLPNILLDYLYRFEWEADNYCQGSAVHFIPHFIPTPDSIFWYFGEFTPGSTSNELSPTYTFKYPGIHEVEVDIWYPTGRFEHTSREIEIFPTPKPDLGPDTLICEGSSITLYANCDADFYTWNGIPGISEYIVSDSGTYRVSATFLETGCSGSDTIHVGFYPPILIDETNLIITPTSCNGASGSITGLYALGSAPLAYRWKDLSEVEYGSDIDVYDLPAGQYYLTITDGKGCEMVSEVYTIEDAGNLQVTQVQTNRPHCFRPDGQIIIHAFSPSGSTLSYSINDGADYSTDSVFTGLLAGNYIIRIRDINECEGFYIDNPVILEDIPGPQVTQVNVTDETDFLGNGAIEIIANGSTPVIYYSIDSGATYQSNNGAFNNVVCGMYYVIIKDENGCDTTFTVEIQNIILTYLQAITGPGEHCLGDAVTIPIKVENFNSVATFRLQLSYNKDNLQCEGYTNADPQLQQNLTAWVDQAAGEITFQWQDTLAVTLNQPDTVAELVFTAKQQGLGDIAWYTGATESYFRNLQGSAIPAEFHTGEVNIYEPPHILLSASKNVCEGQSLFIMSIASGNQPPLTYRWIYPTGDTTNSDPFFFSVTPTDAGIYTLLATDRVGCTDQKSIELIVSENPVAAFHGMDTLEMQAGDVLDAGAGMESYKWNTGDTTESIIIPSVGMYVVEMESLFGCTGKDSIYIKLTSDEIPSNNIFIPNAFSPDGDGLNDLFMAYATSDYIQKFHMLIFDRWGGEIFESNDIYLGWDGTKHGKHLPGGMYTYKITYSIYPSFGDYSEQVRFGTVMLVR